MRTITLFLVLIFPCFCSTKAQEAGYKTIPGLLTSDMWRPVERKLMHVSSDGKEVAIQQFTASYMLRINEGRFTVLNPDWPEYYSFSPDHSFIYSNVTNINIITKRNTFFAAIPGEQQPRSYAGFIGQLTATKFQKVFADTNYIVGVNGQNQLIVSTPLTRDKYLLGLVGLRLIDRNTGKILKLLRTDTISTTVSIPYLFLNSSCTAFLTTDVSRGDTHIYPFGSDTIVHFSLGEDTWTKHIMSDEHYIYMFSDDQLFVYSIHTGKLLYKAVYPRADKTKRYVYERCLYAQAANGRLYRFDREQETVYEELVTPDSLHTLKTYPLHIENDRPFLGYPQWYEMVTVAGPALLIIPHNRYDGDVPENAGYVINLPTGQISLKIAPFYNASNEQIVKEQQFRESENAAAAKAEADKKQTELKYKLGSSFRKKDGGYSSDEYFVVYYDAAKNLYGFVTRTYISAKKTVFKTNDNVGHYSFSYSDVPGSYIDNKFTPTGKVYQFCSVCKGSGVTYVTQKRTTGGWEQVNFNVHVFTPYTVTASWEERVTCPQCFGVGIKEVY